MNETKPPLLNPEAFQSVDAIEATLRDRLPWLWYPAFEIGPNEGYDGRRFGARAGPLEAKTCSNVLHEVGHAVEMTLLPSRIWKRRVRLPQFELRVRSYLDIGADRYYEPRTMQPTERECRVGGIQLRLLEAGGFATASFVRNYGITLRYMADWWFGGSYPSHPQEPQKRWSTEERRWLDLRKSLVRKAYKQFTLPDIQKRWEAVMTWQQTALQQK